VGKLVAGEYDALVLARAGLLRLGRRKGVRVVPIPFSVMLPPAGQGTLVAEARADDRRTRALLAAIDDPDLALASSLERQVTGELGAGCHGGLGVLATVKSERVNLRAVVVTTDGRTLIRAAAHGTCEAAEDVVRRVVERLRALGAQALVTAAAPPASAGSGPTPPR
jgi:hydroxymethylbilane synthase